MIIKLPKPTKAERICAILSYWDPCRKKDEADPMYYNYEAETLAQSVRKNSKVESVAKRLKELIDAKLESEGIEYRVDEDNAKRVAAAILAGEKNQR